MRLTVLGCSPSYQNPGGHSSSYLLHQDGTQALIDCGHGATGALRAVTELSSLSAIVLSHMHPDHFFDLVPLRYAFRASRLTDSTPLWVPPNGAAFLTSLLGPLGLPPDFFSGTFRVREYDPSSMLRIGSMELRFALTRHFIPGYAIRVTPSGNTRPVFFFSSDTAWLEELGTLAQGANLALIEATQTHEDAEHDQGHLTGALAGQLARDAGARRLLLTHYPQDVGEQLLAQARKEFSGLVELARELETYEV